MPGFVGNGRTCSDENECGDEKLFQCDPNAKCVNMVGTYEYECLAGFKGDGKTCINLDECALGIDTCDSNAECFDTDGSFTCACNAGYEGDGTACADINECLNPLDNDCSESGKICFNTVGSFECLKPPCKSFPGYVGRVDCDWFAGAYHVYCPVLGDQISNSGYTAYQACCTCGGSI
jgi:hypothetical protein